MSRDEDKNRRYNRSVRLRKYESVYRQVTKERESVSSDSSKQKKRSLNSYQKFVKQESKKDKYRNMRGSERLSAIASAWEHKKRYGRRRKK